MRLAPHDGQKPRRLQLKATSLSCPQSPQRSRRKPWARMPHSRKASNSSLTRDRPQDLGLPPLGGRLVAPVLSAQLPTYAVTLGDGPRQRSDKRLLPLAANWFYRAIAVGDL